MTVGRELATLEVGSQVEPRGAKRASTRTCELDIGDTVGNTNDADGIDKLVVSDAVETNAKPIGILAKGR